MTDTAAALRELIVPPKKRAIYYTFAHVMIELLELHQIRYFAHSGTMLGAARHAGFIPWDDDVDVMIDQEDEGRLHNLMKVIEDYGIKFGTSRTIESGLVQFVPFGQRILGGSNYFMGFDVFIGQRVIIGNEEVLHYKSENFRRWFKDRYVAVSDAFPRKKYRFGPINIWGMHDPSDYFLRSGFKLDEAIIGVHKGAQERAHKVIEQLLANSSYPIKDPDILKMESPYSSVDLYDLEHYQASGA